MTLVSIAKGKRRDSKAVWFSKIGLGLFVAGVSLMTSAGKASATSYYVSPSGNNTTGTSWSTAWNELNQIQWSTLKAGDTVQIDGGKSSVTYGTTLTFPASAPAVQVAASIQSGHTGKVILDGTVNKSGPGINILGSANLFAKATGTDKTRFIIQNFSTGMTINQPSTATLSLNGLTFLTDTTGISITNVGPPTGPPPSIVACIFQDCIYAGIYNTSPNPVSVTYSWFHNTTPPPSTANANPEAGIYGWNGSQNCVFGPYLNFGIFTASGSGQNVLAKNCLFLNCFDGNFWLNEGSGSQSFPGGIEYITSFMTPLNPYKQSHNNFYGNGLFSVGGSVFYGGAIAVPAGINDNRNQPANDQYNVTGNTTALATTQVDPQFNTASVYTLPNNVTASTLINTDFSVKASLGSSLTSVSQLLNLMSGQ